MEFGTPLPRWSPYAGPASWRAVAETADDAGYDWIGRGDHVVFTDAEDSWGIETPTTDVFAVLAFAAGITDRITVGTNVCVVPYRHPVVLAKAALTLDVLAEGRFEFGVGAGWCRSEFEVLDAPFEHRGELTDEFLELFERVRAEPVFAFDGPHHSFGRTGFHPRPADDGPPVLVGGYSGPAFRRVAEYGDGWTVGVHGTDDPEEIAEAVERIGRAWDDFDREGEPVVAVASRASLGDDAPDDGGPLVGSVDAVVDGVERLREAGATRVSPDFADHADGVDEHVAQLRRFADEVMPSF